jgi:hypothetical protein
MKEVEDKLLFLPTEEIYREKKPLSLKGIPHQQAVRQNCLSLGSLP